MPRRHPVFATLAAIGLACLIRVGTLADEPKKAPPSKEQIAQWVRDLEDDDFEKRQEATKRLWEAGKSAEPALREAVKNPDPEVQRRSREVLDRFKWGIYPDTPEKIVNLIHDYQGVDKPDAKRESTGKFLGEGEPGLAALGKILQAEENVATRQAVIKFIEREAGRALAKTPESKYDSFESLLEACLIDTPAPDFHHLAAFCLVSGRLDDRIKFYKDQLGTETKLPVDKILAHLLRVKGDFAEALKVAGKDEKLKMRILYQQRDWKGLAQLKLTEPADETTRLILQATFNRLAGNADEAKSMFDDLGKRAASSDPNTSRMLRMRLSRAYFLNDRVKDAMTSLDGEADVTFKASLLAVQLRYDDALELLKDNIEKQKTPEGKVRLELQRARLHLQVGEKDKAVKIFESLADEIKPPANPQQRLLWPVDLVRTELRAGLKGLARNHGVKSITLLDKASAKLLLKEFYPEGSDAAYIWWVLVRNKVDDKRDTAEKWKQVQSIMEGKADELTKWREALETDITEDPIETYLALAHACQAAGLKKEAQGYLEKACAKSDHPALPYVKLGDFFAVEQKWDKAADAYRQAAEHDGADPLPLYLQGRALVKAGKTEDGKKLTELSHWVPLANDDKRFQFELELTRRGFAKDARRERELVLKVDDSASVYTSIALEREANEALAKKEYLTAADYFEASMLRVLEPGTIFTDPSAYFLQPQRVHRYRARGLLDQGKIDAALKEADYCLDNFSGDIELPILMTVGLEKNEHKKDADRIYAKVHDTIAKVCEQYPQSGWGQNSLGWLCAVCRRDLDEGLKHAQKAMDLSPDNTGYLDTLAELNFQMGKKDKALELMRKCVELEPKRSYFRKQLARMEKGDPDVPVELEVRVGEGADD